MFIALLFAMSKDWGQSKYPLQKNKLVYSYNVIWYNSENEWTTVIWNSMDESQNSVGGGLLSKSWNNRPKGKAKQYSF